MVGFFGISISVFYVIIVISSRNRSIAFPLVSGLISRLVFMSLNNLYIFRVPAADADTVAFLKLATELAALPWVEFIAKFSFSHAYLFSWVGALLFRIFEPSELLFQSLNLLLGLIGIHLVYKITLCVWDKRKATFAAYCMAFFPFAIFNSIIVLREEIAITAFLAGLLFTVYWVETKKPGNLMLAVVGFGCAGMFHGGWILAIVGLVIVVLIETVTGNNVRNSKLYATASVVVLLALLGYASTSQLSFSNNIGNPLDLLSGKGSAILETQLEREARGDSAYPAFVATGNPITQPWFLPARVGYFLFSPFPWDIKAVRHIFGMVGGVTYMWIALRMYKGRKNIKANHKARAIFIIVGILVFVFALGTSNIGTALRHRTKFFGALLVLAMSSIKLKKRKP